MSDDNSYTDNKMANTELCKWSEEVVFLENSPNMRKRSANAIVATTTTSMSTTVCNILADRVAACDCRGNRSSVGPPRLEAGQARLG